MKKHQWLSGIYFFCFVFIAINAHSTNYYFSSSEGDDSRSFFLAQNQSTPWKSLSKLAFISSRLKPGDSVLFKRGDVFIGSIQVNASGNVSSPIVFTAYGVGAKPVISGLTNFNSWTQTGNKTWETDASMAGPELNIVLLNNKFQPIGRYPNNDAENGGYLPVESFSANSSISNNSLNNGINWSGGEIVIRKNRWILDRNKINDQSGNTIQYSSGSGYYATAGYGFFLQNHPSALDREGEWYYQNKRLGVFLNGSPASYTIQGSIVPVLVSINNKNNIVFSGLEFKGANNNAFEIRNSDNIVVVNCSVLYSGNNALDVSDCSGLKIEGTEINTANNIALNLTNCWQASIKNNSIVNTATVAGMGKSGDGSYEAVLLSGNNNLVEGNQIENTGYIPISFNGSSVTIKNNLVKSFTLVKDDGGGIYTWNNGSNSPTYTNRTITGNIILNGHTANEGTNSTSNKYSHGIYLDDNSANVDVTSNTVASCEGFGLYIHNAANNSIQQNTVYNNTVQIVMEHDDIAPNHPIRNTVVTDNIFFSLASAQLTAEYKSRANDIADFASFDNNYYCRPVDEEATIGVLKNINGVYSYQQTDVDGWKAMYGKDNASQSSPKKFIPYILTGLLGANKFTNGNFTNNINGLYAYSPANNCQTNWNNGELDGGNLSVSFSSITNNNKGTIVIGVGAVTAGKKYLLRFSLKGSNENKLLDVYLRKSGAPYNDITERKLVKIKSQRREVELLFTAAETTNDGSIGIDVPEQNSPVYFDNIELKETEASTINITDSIKFLYNANNSAASSVLNGNFIDVKSTNYNGAISLQPSSSAVLLAKSDTVEVSQANCSATGSILREKWLGITGNDVAQIPLTITPANSIEINSFEVLPNSGDNYGTRIRGYICPPQTGYYTFFIAGDDGTELWLSTNENPSGKTKIAYSLSWTDFRQWTKYASQKSVAIYLHAGKKYYIEALQKEGNGGDHLSVAWQMPDGYFEAPIAGSHLSPYIILQTTCSATGFILREQWNNINGNDVVQVPQQTTPSFTMLINKFEGPVNAGDQYGSRIRGYICAPQTGYYTFWIAGDDGTELWLSDNDDPGNKRKIAYSLSWTGYREWDKYASQKSIAIYLEAGKKYYIEAMQKEGNGGDHLSVAWQMPDGKKETPITGNWLSPFVADATQALKTSTLQTELVQDVSANPAVISCYPNPFSKEVVIEVLSKQTAIARVEILTLPVKK